MKTLLLSLCAGMLAATAPCQAQQPAANEPAPLLLVYVVKQGDNALPRIALGLEKPSLKISAFEKCVSVSTRNPKLNGLAVQLKTDDAKALVAAMKTLGAPDARELPNVVLWFTTPDNKALDYLSTATTNDIETNLKAGIIEFDADSEGTITRYLSTQLHPE